MSTESRLARRRTPRQKRSKIVFERIINTAKALFEREGYAYVSTNLIAEKAGVSIGSLYQYFANRESVALAVYEDASSRAALTMKRKALQILGAPLDESISKNIEWVLDVFESDRYALLQLINEIPALHRAARPVSFESLIRHTTQMFLEQHFPGAERAAIARKAYLIDACVLGAVQRYLDEKPDILDRHQTISELAALVYLYASTLREPRLSDQRGSEDDGTSRRSTKQRQAQT